MLDETENTAPDPSEARQVATAWAAEGKAGRDSTEDEWGADPLLAPVTPERRVQRFSESAPA